jgi:hypothetical protein
MLVSCPPFPLARRGTSTDFGPCCTADFWHSRYLFRNYVQAMHTDYVGVRGYQDVGELPSFPLGALWQVY